VFRNRSCKRAAVHEQLEGVGEERAVSAPARVLGVRRCSGQHKGRAPSRFAGNQQGVMHASGRPPCRLLLYLGSLCAQAARPPVQSNTLGRLDPDAASDPCAAEPIPAAAAYSSFPGLGYGPAATSRRLHLARA